ncbi:MAG TPA: DUF3307 domain-containing protein [Bacillales bacterium]|nr:DUF3307 domain-containing protein [Bacillales bacterium]
MLELILTFVFAHFLTDFFFQTNRMIQLKKTHLHLGLTYHTACHFMAASLGAIIYAFIAGRAAPIFILTLMAAALAIAVIHYLIDWAKEFLNLKYSRVTFSAVLFILDQIFHVVSIVVVLRGAGLISLTWSQFESRSLDFLFADVAFSNASKLLLLLILFILATEGSGYFLGIVLRDLSPNPSIGKETYNITNEKTEMRTTMNEKGERTNEITAVKTEQIYKDSPQKIGRYIGMIERLLIMVFIIQGTPYGLPFLIAVKSLTRFKQLENKRFAEYYLIGSLSSALIAIVLGYAVVQVL